MNLLPGLRELRAPLTSGYLWLLSAWLLLGGLGWLPTKRPLGDGEVARVWDLGGTLGTTVVLAVVTFIAYLIGSFLEIDPDGRLGRRLRPLVHLWRREPSTGPDDADKKTDRGGRKAVFPFSLGHISFWAPSYALGGIPVKRFKEFLKQTLKVDELSGEEEQRYTAERLRGTAQYVHRSLSKHARNDLIELLEQRGKFPDTVTNALKKEGTYSDEQWKKLEPDYKAAQLVADQFIAEIINDMRQLASKLLVENQELYGKYDRHMAEAAVRINVSIPLTVLLFFATVFATGLPGALKVLLVFAILAAGFLLLRQGLLRTVSARDVIVQALTIEEVESSHIPAEERSESLEEQPKGRKPETAGGFSRSEHRVKRARGEPKPQ